MIDLEQELRELFQRREADVQPSLKPAREVIQKARRRQFRTALAAGLTALAVAAGSFTGVRAVLDQDPSERLGDVPAPTPPPRGLGVPEDRIVITSGEFVGGMWELATWEEPNSPGRWCLGVHLIETRQQEGPDTSTFNGGSRCGPRSSLQPTRPISLLGDGRVETQREGGVTIRRRIIGQIGEPVEALRVELRNGRVLEPDIIQPPEVLSDLHGFFVFVFRGRSGGLIWGLDAEGRTVGGTGF